MECRAERDPAPAQKPENPWPISVHRPATLGERRQLRSRKTAARTGQTLKTENASLRGSMRYVAKERRALQEKYNELLKWKRRMLRDKEGVVNDERVHNLQVLVGKLKGALERARDPSIPQRALRKIRRAAKTIHDVPGLTESEKILFQRAVKHGYEIHRHGWPDFLMIHKDTGRIRFIEVKSPHDSLSDSQILMCKALQECGIEVEVFKAGPNRFQPWHEVAKSAGVDVPQVRGWSHVLPPNEPTTRGVHARPTGQRDGGQGRET